MKICLYIWISSEITMITNLVTFLERWKVRMRRSFFFLEYELG